MYRRWGRRAAGPQSGRTKRKRVGAWLGLAVCVAAAMSSIASSGHRSVASQPSTFVEDFDEAWAFIRDTYAYIDEKAVDWQQARNRLRPRVGAIRDNREFIALLEELIEHLYDHHAHLGVNTPSSPRLIPSAADLWASHRNDTALITDVRRGSDAENVGLRPGMQIVSIDGRPAGDAVQDRLPAAVDPQNATARDWGLRVLLAGRRKAPVRLKVRDRDQLRSFEFWPGRVDRPDAVLTEELLDNRIGYIRLHNSLGQVAVVAAWDAALDKFRETEGLILDLRDTPGGGNSTVARGLLGRLVQEVQPYQQHDVPGEERRYGIRRIWMEHVAPRGPYSYDKPIAVLVGRWTASMGEGIAIGLDGTRRATVFGSAMAQLRGAIYTRTLEHTKITLRVPAERLYHVDGTPREAFVPRAPVAPSTPGEDAVLKQALDWIQKQPSPGRLEPGLAGAHPRRERYRRFSRRSGGRPPSGARSRHPGCPRPGRRPCTCRGA